MRKDATFIGIEVNDAVAADPAVARRLEEACPVDIYVATDAGLEIVEPNIDECVLCGLCLAASPEGSVQVLKLYDGGAKLARA